MTSEPRPGAGGPKTAAGKARSAQNALRHGFAGAPVWAADGPDAARLAALVAGPAASPARLAAAAAFAAAHFELRRIRRARREILLRPHVDPPPPTYALVKALTRLGSGQAPDDDARRVATALGGPRPLPLWAAAAARLRELAALERYERRAFSRRQSAVRSLDALALADAAAPCGAPAAGVAAASAAAIGMAAGPTATANLAERTVPAHAAHPAPGAVEAPATQTNHGTPAARDPADAACEADDASERVETLAFAGLSPERIARLVNLPVATLRDRHGHALDCGADLTTARIVSSLVRRAEAGDTRAAIFLLSSRAGWRATGPVAKPPDAAIDEAEKRKIIDRIMKLAHETRNSSAHASGEPGAAGCGGSR